MGATQGYLNSSIELALTLQSTQAGFDGHEEVRGSSSMQC